MGFPIVILLREIARNCALLLLYCVELNGIVRYCFCIAWNCAELCATVYVLRGIAWNCAELCATVFVLRWIARNCALLFMHCVKLRGIVTLLFSYCAELPGIVRYCFRIARNYAELCATVFVLRVEVCGNYRARNCAQVKSTYVLSQISWFF